MKKNCPVQAKFWEMQPRQLATTSEDGGFLPTSVPRQVYLVTKEPKQHFHWCKFLRLFYFFCLSKTKTWQAFLWKKNLTEEIRFTHTNADSESTCCCGYTGRKIRGKSADSAVFYFFRIVIARKGRTNSTFWHHFWRGFESSFLDHFPNWKSDDFCGI